MEKLMLSACLLGLACRYDGAGLDDKECGARANRLATLFHLVPVCPEQLGGLPTPRKQMFFQLRPGADPARPGGVVVDIEGEDRTEALKSGAKACVKIATLLGIRRALLKERSPSCGVREVYLGQERVEGQGITARALREAGLEVVSSEMERKLLRED